MGLSTVVWQTFSYHGNNTVRITPLVCWVGCAVAWHHQISLQPRTSDALKMLPVGALKRSLLVPSNASCWCPQTLPVVPTYILTVHTYVQLISGSLSHHGKTKSQTEILCTWWGFGIARIWLVSLDFCFSVMGQSTGNWLYLKPHGGYIAQTVGGVSIALSL